MPNIPATPDRKSQSESFIETARSIGADESEAAFEETLKKLGKHKPVKEEKETSE